jgi:hypothetical protein
MKMGRRTHYAVVGGGLLTLAAALTAPAAPVAPAAALAAPAGIFAPAPAAPKLTNEPIQHLGDLFQDAFTDAAGRAWLLARRKDIGFVKHKVVFEYLVCPDLPGKTIEIPEKNIPLGFDCKGRLWEITRYGLGWTEGATGEFAERQFAPGLEVDRPSAADPYRGEMVPGFARAMLEHSSGRLYFADSYGLHVLDGETWSYRAFEPRPKRPQPRAGESPPVKLVECPDGTVIYWGDGGFWTHDGSAWRQCSGRTNGFAPLAGERCLLTNGNIISLGGKAQQSPDAASSELTKRLSGFEHVLTVGRGATLVKRYDPNTTYYTLAMVTPAGEVVDLPADVSLPIEQGLRPRPAPKLPDGRVILPTMPLCTWDGRQAAPLFANPFAPPGRCLTADGSGRVFLAADNQEFSSDFHRLVAASHESLSAAPSLPAEMFGLVELAVLDSTGRVWAKFVHQPFVSRFEGGQWRHLPPPPGLAESKKGVYYGPMTLHPLANGRLVVRAPGRGACLYDGERWTVAESLTSLVEAEAANLRKLIDNRLGSQAGPPMLGLDAGGRIWTYGQAKGESTAPGIRIYDAGRWSGLEGQFLISPDGACCIRSNIGQRGAEIRDGAVGPANVLTSLPKDAEMPFQHWAVSFDRQGRFIAHGDINDPAWRWDGKEWTKLGGSDWCVLADSLGRLWFKNFGRLVIVDGSGKSGPPYDHPAGQVGPVVEQAPGEYWCLAVDGLLQLGTADKRKGPAVVVRRRYDDLVPQGDLKRIFLDGEGWLWVVTNRLGRIKLPPTAPKEAR